MDLCYIVVVIDGWANALYGKGATKEEAIKDALEESGRQYKLRRYIVYHCPSDSFVNQWNQVICPNGGNAQLIEKVGL